jgi:hypothetical protein
MSFAGLQPPPGSTHLPSAPGERKPTAARASSQPIPPTADEAEHAALTRPHRVAEPTAAKAVHRPSAAWTSVAATSSCSTGSSTTSAAASGVRLLRKLAFHEPCDESCVRKPNEVGWYPVAPRFRLFPRYRRPSLGEILGTTQAKRRISRKLGLATLRDPSTPIKNVGRRAKRRAGYYSEPAKMVRHLGCLLPLSCLALLPIGLQTMRQVIGHHTTARST